MAVTDKKSEPVLVTMSILGGLSFLFGGMSATGLGAGNDTVALVGAWGTLATAAATFGIQFYVRGQVTPVGDVAAKVNSDRQVVAGEASDLPVSTPVDVVESGESTNPDLR